MAKPKVFKARRTPLSNVLTSSREQRTAICKRPARPPSALDQATRDRVLELCREGATLSEVCTERKVTSYTRLYHTRTVDPAFDDDVRKALAMGAEAALSEAQEFSKSAAESGNPDLMRVAESFGRVSVLYAEKIAPREYGQLIKLGGADGGALSVQVVSYALPAVPKLEQLAVDPRTRAITADFQDIEARSEDVPA